jgi:hypothetical protein
LIFFFPQLKTQSGWRATKKKAQLRTKFNRFKQSVFLLEKQFENMELAMKNRGENPAVSCGKLTMGIIAGVLT